MEFSSPPPSSNHSPQPTPPPHTPHSPNSHNNNTPPHRTHRELSRSRKLEFAENAIAIAQKNAKPNNIHKEQIPTFVSQDITDNVELCYMKREQCGWVPLMNVDPGYDFDNDKASFDLWWELKNSHNPEGAEKHLNSPRLYNYRKRHGMTGILPADGKLDPSRNANFINEKKYDENYYSHLTQKKETEIALKITQSDGPVGREGWRAYATLGNGVVRWTDDIFEWNKTTHHLVDEAGGTGKSIHLMPKELEPMYSSFTNDKIFRWEKPAPKKVRAPSSPRKSVKPSLSEIVKDADLRRQKALVFGCKNGTRVHSKQPQTENKNEHENENENESEIESENNRNKNKITPQPSPKLSVTAVTVSPRGRKKKIHTVEFKNVVF